MQLWRVDHGDALDKLGAMEDESVHAVVTSPPYWGLRDYKTGGRQWPEIEYQPVAGVTVTVPPWRGELGHEPRVVEFIAHLVHVMREVKRVLRPEGTAWIVIGDTYQSDARGKTPGSFGLSGGVKDAGCYPLSGPNRTTGAAALTLGRSYIGIEANQDFAQIQRSRLHRRSLVAIEEDREPTAAPSLGPLFEERS